jgi:glyoxylase-like metal-dependent hydrolase (beta-lactamase superfamily II)
MEPPFMTWFICRTCAVQYRSSEQPPPACIICDDERQYVGWQGQRWTTMEELAAEGLRTDVRDLEPGLTGIGTTPSLAIGQRALLVQSDHGNVLWDCPGFLDRAAVDRVRELGGLAGISASHPHFYGCIVEWSRAFGGAPIYLPRADADWITRPDPAVSLWEDRVEVVPGVTLIQCGGHFAGSAVLHWSRGAAGRGVLLVGDTITVVNDRRYVSFMRSYPNLIPLPGAEVERIVARLDPVEFDRIYGGWWDRDVAEGAAEAVRASARRYAAWLDRMQSP